jgi:hypothetical protein
VLVSYLLFIHHWEREVVPVPMHHSERRSALYLLLPWGVIRMASSKDALRVDILR